MKTCTLGKSKIEVPAVAIGCMRMTELRDAREADEFVHFCVENGVNFFDHADIYGGGECERIFGEVLQNDKSLRDHIFLQSKCGIVPGVMYDLSREYILKSVDGILERLQTDHLDMLVLHRPDALLEPEEIASAFESLKSSGKVLHFGVSNFNPMQISLLQKALSDPLLVNQMQLSIAASSMISSGMEVNMTTDGAVMRDGSVLDYCRLHEITLQTWSPFQIPGWRGTFLGSDEYRELNDVLDELADKYQTSAGAVAAAWILRHPAGMQLLCGSMKKSRVEEIIQASEIVLTREEWYRLYLSAGHILP